MVKLDKVLITPKALAYLKKRNLEKQYKKAKQLLISGNHSQVRFKKRQPHSNNIYYFRINKQYRAFGTFINPATFVVTYIDNHS